MSGWKDCEFCGIRLNGEYKMHLHELEVHPAEKRRRVAESKVHQWEKEVAREEQSLVRYDALAAALQEPMPEIARRLVQKAFDSYPPHTPYGSGVQLTPREVLVVNMETSQTILAKAKQDLVEALAAVAS